MRTILLSFESDSFARLQSGIKTIEYRKNFPDGNVKAYFYVSKPVMAITGIAHFAERQNIKDLLHKYLCKDELIEKVEKELIGNRFAVPIKCFQETNKISLELLRKDISKFFVPRMYYFIDNSELLSYLEKQMVSIEQPIIHDITSLTSIDVFKSANIGSFSC